jgi:hypothetical protein
MPLVECPDCQHMISDMAPACIHCGRPGNTFGRSAISETPGQVSAPSSPLATPNRVLETRATKTAKAGWVYVLINAAMPGLVKVGRTANDPEQRVAELSRPTGIASPFQLAYDAYFQDCTRAEEFVHTTLGRAGQRHSPSREFFAASVKEVIKAVIKAERALSSSVTTELQDVEDSTEGGAGLGTGVGEDHLDYPEDHRNSLEDLQESLMDEAMDYEYGTPSRPDNPEKALVLYKKAAKLGAKGSWVSVGRMYRWGDGCREDEQQALRWFREGAEHGDSQSLADLADVYARGDLGVAVSAENAAKCWRRYFREIQRDIPAYLSPETQNQLVLRSLEGYVNALIATRLDSEDERVLTELRTAFLEQLARSDDADAPQRRNEFTRLLARVGL